MASDDTPDRSTSQASFPGDPIPAPVQEVLDLFASDLADVRFPNVDHETLSALADAVREEARALEEARQVVDAARARLGQRQEALLQRVGQGVAYVRVFAAGDQALEARVGQLAVVKAEARPAKKKTRKRRAAAAPAAARSTSRTHGRATAELPLSGSTGQLIQLEAVG